MLASVGNMAVGVLAFLIWAFVTDSGPSDATVRIAYYLLPAIVLLAVVGMILPWVLAGRHSLRGAWIAALAPTLLLGAVVVAFLVLDSWVRRTFG